MLTIDLKGKRVFIAGVADDQGYGWAILKALTEAGAEIIVGTWPPVLKIFKMALAGGKLNTKLSDGSDIAIQEIFPLDAMFDTMEDVPPEIRENKRYQAISGYTISEVAKAVGPIDILVHSLANGPEVKKPLIETSRKGYLAAVSSSAYSFVSMIQHFQIKEGGAALNLSYMASERTVPGYGGGMSSAKAALESDTRTLAFEAGRKSGIRLNSISAGPLPSRAAKAIGMIEKMCEYCAAQSPLQKEMKAQEVGQTAAFLLSPLASAITGSTIYVDNGYHSMGCATENP